MAKTKEEWIRYFMREFDCDRRYAEQIYAMEIGKLPITGDVVIKGEPNGKSKRLKAKRKGR